MRAIGRRKGREDRKGGCSRRRGCTERGQGVTYERLVPLAAGNLFEANIQSAAHRRGSAASERARTAEGEAADRDIACEVWQRPRKPFEIGDPVNVGRRCRRRLDAGALSGQPAASVPAGWTSAGLPVGLQIIGRRSGEVTVLSAGVRARHRFFPSLDPRVLSAEGDVRQEKDQDWPVAHFL